MEAVRRFKVAAVQAAPVYPLDKKATTEKACRLIEEAGRNGARLIVLPETFIPTYPNFSIDLQNPTEWPRNLVAYTRHSIKVPGEETALLGEAARRAGAYVCIGVSERTRLYQGMLYNSQLFFGPDGSLLGKRRKLLPSNREKIFWHRGDGIDLRCTFETDLGRIGGLICYEHLQPLFKYALIAQGEEVHCACWPGWPNFEGGRTNVPIVDVSSRAHAVEGQCFVVIASLYVPPEVGGRSGFGNASWTFFGGSGIVGPSGEYLVGPVYEREITLYADIDLDLIPLRKAAIDTTGRDSRWDVIRLNFKEVFYPPFSGGSDLEQKVNEGIGLPARLSKGQPGEVADRLERLAERLERLLARLEAFEGPPR